MNILENSAYYRLGGRYIKNDDILYLSYSASYIELEFTGNRAAVEFVTEGFDDSGLFDAWAAVFINDELTPSMRIPVKKGRSRVVVYESDVVGDIRIKIMRYSEAAFAELGIAAIDISGTPRIMQKSDKRLIELVGDSITCGYGIEGENEKDIFSTATENPWTNYAGQLARAFDADYQLVSWSGNGVVSHFIGEYTEEPRVENFFLQDLYPYADAELERRWGRQEYTPWDFSRQPQLIIINLGTNDSSFTRWKTERNRLYMEAYTKLLRLVRKNNPEAAILCILGVMEQQLDKTLEETVRYYNETENDKVHFLRLELQRAEDGYAVDGHPSLTAHTRLAATLAEYIKEKELL